MLLHPNQKKDGSSVKEKDSNRILAHFRAHKLFKEICFPRQGSFKEKQDRKDLWMEMHYTMEGRISISLMNQKSSLQSRYEERMRERYRDAFPLRREETVLMKKLGLERQRKKPKDYGKRWIPEIGFSSLKRCSARVSTFEEILLPEG
jgi:hypothetical protein